MCVSVCLSDPTCMISSSVLPSFYSSCQEWQHDVCSWVIFRRSIMCLLLAVKEPLCACVCVNVCVCVSVLYRESMNQEWFMWCELEQHILLTITCVLMCKIFRKKGKFSYLRNERGWWLVMAFICTQKERKKERKNEGRAWAVCLAADSVTDICVNCVNDTYTQMCVLWM